MNNRIKTIIITIITVIVSILIINFFTKDREGVISGTITVVTDKYTNEYISELAENYMNGHSRTKINIELIDNIKDLDNKFKEGKKDNLPNIAILNSYELDYLKNKYKLNFENEEDLLNIYKRNFTKSSLQQITIDGKEMGIPLTTNPLVLYLREDILKQYGYKSSDINTWDDFIKVSKNIYKKSNGKYKGLSIIDDDYENLIKVLIMQNIDYFNNKEEVIKAVKKDYKNLEDNKILAREGDDFFAIISSINTMKILKDLRKNCEWTVNDIPAYKIGSNRFFVADGYSAFVINNDKKNRELINIFSEYMITNTDIALEYALNGDLFPTYIYAYNNKEIEKSMNNFIGKSPLVVMSNISKKAPKIKNYNLYKEVKKELLK